MKILESMKKCQALLFVSLITWGSSVPSILKAAENDGHGLDETADQAFGNNIPFKEQGPPEIIGTVVGAALSFIGVLFFILIIYGGITWMTAAGNETQISKAKSLIVSALIGLIIVLAAYAITSFIGGALT